MAGFHINTDTDRVNKCDTTPDKCPIGGAHFTTKDEATEYKDSLHKKVNPSVNTMKKPRGKQLKTRMFESRTIVSKMKAAVRRLDSEKLSLMNESFGKEVLKGTPMYEKILKNISDTEEMKNKLSVAKLELDALEKEYEKKHPKPEPPVYNRDYYYSGGCGGGGC